MCKVGAWRAQAHRAERDRSRTHTHHLVTPNVGMYECLCSAHRQGSLTVDSTCSRGSRGGRRGAGTRPGHVHDNEYKFNRRRRRVSHGPPVPRRDALVAGVATAARPVTYSPSHRPVTPRDAPQRRQRTRPPATWRRRARAGGRVAPPDGVSAPESPCCRRREPWPCAAAVPSAPKRYPMTAVEVPRAARASRGATAPSAGLGPRGDATCCSAAAPANLTEPRAAPRAGTPSVDTAPHAPFPAPANHSYPGRLHRPASCSSGQILISGRPLARPCTLQRTHL